MPHPPISRSLLERDHEGPLNDGRNQIAVNGILKVNPQFVVASLKIYVPTFSAGTRLRQTLSVGDNELVSVKWRRHCDDAAPGPQAAANLLSQIRIPIGTTNPYSSVDYVLAVWRENKSKVCFDAPVADDRGQISRYLHGRQTFSIPHGEKAFSFPTAP